MAKFKVTIQFYKVFDVEAEDVTTAKQDAQNQAQNIISLVDKFTVNEPSNLTAKKEKRKAFEAKKKAEKEEANKKEVKSE